LPHARSRAEMILLHLRAQHPAYQPPGVGPDRASPHGAYREELTGCDKGEKVQRVRKISLTF
jgi:hypothetical protein